MGAGSRFLPGRWLPALAAGGVPFALADGGTGLGIGLALTYDAVLVIGAWAESRRLAGRVPAVERQAAKRLVVGVPNRVVLQLHNPTDRTLRLTVRDDLPPGWEARPPELTAELPPFARRELTYTVSPPRRGRFDFGDLHLRIEGGLRLGARVVRLERAEAARVYPNVLGPRRYELAARLGDLSRLGVRAVRRAGGGGELEQLREYVPGDPYRDLDWKSTAKRLRPVTRVYEQERSQRVLIALDAGRMMAPRLERISKLDHAINAALLLAYVALRQDDRVGLVVFSDRVMRFVPPGKGPAQYRRLLEALYEVEARETFVDFRRLVEFLQVRVPRRSLLVMFSDLLDDAQAGPLVEHVGLLQRRHLPVCVTLRDPIAERLADDPDEADVHRRAAAADLLAEREALKLRLRKRGVGLVEAGVGDLAVATVNRYLDVKARRAL
ncbi:MAG: DUF58 domain-containing protein [Sandaracinaceae bacterium]